MIRSDSADGQPFSLISNFPDNQERPVRRHLLGFVERVSGLRNLQRMYEALPPFEDASSFIDRAFESLDISYHTSQSELEHIPAQGAAIVVANHPFGGVDGMILTHLLCKIRPDVRVLANYHLNRIPALRELFFVVDPFESAESKKRNLKPLRDSLRWLKNDGLLVVFPAGEVSHYHLRHRQVSDPQWADTVGRIVMRTQSPVIPVCFQGRNSALFSFAGMIHPRLRTLLLPRELIRKSHSKITLSIGKPIKYRKLSCLESPRELTDYLRLRCYLLESDTLNGSHCYQDSDPETEVHVEPVIGPVPRELLRSELAELNDENVLHRSDEFDVIVAQPEQIPQTLREIGRLRELTFRDAGEGTGKCNDIDLFDTWYDHLFIWHRENEEIAGAYRLGPVKEITAKRGKKGLYTHSLFKYRKSLLNSLEPALELGRSFVCSDYQRSFQALNLLWKGIGLYASQKDLAVLFGPVSVSRDYSTSSRKILVDCLRRGGFFSPLSRKVQPRRPLGKNAKHRAYRGDLQIPGDVDLVSEMISQLETDGKGIPVLMRQYLKMGGRFLGFSKDPEFSDVVDGLVVVDLRRCQEKILARFMGKNVAREYLTRLSRCRPTSL